MNGTLVKNQYILARVDSFIKDETYKQVYYKDYGFVNFLDLKNPDDHDPGWILFIPNHMNTDHVKVSINNKYLGYLKDKEGNLIEKGTLNPKFYYIITYKNDNIFYLSKIHREV